MIHNTYIVQLSINSTASTTEDMTLQLGFLGETLRIVTMCSVQPLTSLLGICVTKPPNTPSSANNEIDDNNHDVDDDDGPPVVCLRNYELRDTSSEHLFEDLLREMGLEDASVDEKYKTNMEALLETARKLRDEVFSSADLMAAFALLIAAGLALLVPLFFNQPKRRKVCFFLTILSYLFLAFSLMASGAAVFTAIRTTDLLNDSEEVSIALGSDPIVVKEGSNMHYLLVAALATNGAFAFLASIAACVWDRKTNKSAGPAKKSMWEKGPAKWAHGRQFKVGGYRPAYGRRGLGGGQFGNRRR